LPWHLPDDLRRFKALTLGKPVLMGRKTAQGLGRALPQRRNLVLTRSGRVPFADMEAVTSLEHARSLAGAATLMVIGGGEIYEMTLPLASSMHLTWVDTQVEGADAWFPRFDASEWQITHRQPHAADARHAFAFEDIDYLRIAVTPAQ
jgi:dihydrofolate reductase